MLFNSYTFIALFLPISLLGFYITTSRFSSQATLFWLIFSSLVFYGWWKPSNLWLVVFSVLFNYSIAYSLYHTAQSKIPIKRSSLLIFGVTVNIILLVWFKVESSNLISPGVITTSSFNTSEKILLPLAISFITFQQIAFLVDSYNQKINPNSFLRYCLFITFFPQLLK